MDFGAIDSGWPTASYGGVGPGPTESEAGFVRDLLDVFDANARV